MTSASNVPSSRRGGGGSGIPSANKVPASIRGGGGNGMPSANCFGVSVFLTSGLTDPTPGTTMVPINTIKLDAKVNCAKRMDGTSSGHRWRSHVQLGFATENVPISERWRALYGRPTT